jgi:hypothetical protein
MEGRKRKRGEKERRRSPFEKELCIFFANLDQM